MWQSSSALLCMLRKLGCCTESTYSCWDASTRGACNPSWEYTGTTTTPTSKFQRGLECHASRLCCYIDISAGLTMSSWWNDTRMPKLVVFGKHSKGKCLLHAGRCWPQRLADVLIRQSLMEVNHQTCSPAARGLQSEHCYGKMKASKRVGQLSNIFGWSDLP